MQASVAVIVGVIAASMLAVFAFALFARALGWIGQRLLLHREASRELRHDWWTRFERDLRAYELEQRGHMR